MTNQVLVDRDAYEALLERDLWLYSLEAAGVDNWEGIEYAQTIYNQENSFQPVKCENNIVSLVVNNTTEKENI